MIGGAIFDLDGTILDSMPIWDSAAEMFLDSIGVKAESGLSRFLFSMSMTEGAEFLKHRYCLDMDVDTIIAGVNNTIEDFYFYQVQLKEGVDQFLKGMKQAGIKMVIATASDRLLVERALERLNVLSCFGRIFTCTEIGAGKEKPDIYLAAAEFMGTLPENTWVFEDALYAIRTAKSAGFKTVGVYDAYSVDDADEIKRISDIYLSKLDNIDAFFEEVSFFKERISFNY
ncbi:MAG TPA: HAD family phosphatase [Clostridiaceae bacterium]|nr:HAD family phosphatase [Clostridiaceae bacterium]